MITLEFITVTAPRLRCELDRIHAAAESFRARHDLPREAAEAITAGCYVAKQTGAHISLHNINAKAGSWTDGARSIQWSTLYGADNVSTIEQGITCTTPL